MKLKRYAKVLIKDDPNKEIHEIFRIINIGDKLEYRVRSLNKVPVMQRFFKDDLISARSELLDII